MSSALNSTEMHVTRSTTKTHHHMSSHHSKSQWSIGGSAPSKATKQVWNKKSGCWESKAVTSAAPARAPVRAPATSAPARAVSTKKETKENSMPKNSAPTSQPKKRGQSSNAFANGTRPECGNFITDRPSTRVHAPPGGRSQITFG
eukprot:jgi/Bigna1/88520/estExt_fgenesh1_pg.C_330082